MCYLIHGKNGDRGSNIVTVETTIPGVENTDYKISSKEYSDLLLRLMGIEERPSIIATQAAKAEDLTFRTMVHFFFISRLPEVRLRSFLMYLRIRTVKSIRSFYDVWQEKNHI